MIERRISIMLKDVEAKMQEYECKIAKLESDLRKKNEEILNLYKKDPPASHIIKHLKSYSKKTAGIFISLKGARINSHILVKYITSIVNDIKSGTDISEKFGIK